MSGDFENEYARRKCCLKTLELVEKLSRTKNAKCLLSSVKNITIHLVRQIVL